MKIINKFQGGGVAPYQVYTPAPDMGVQLPTAGTSTASKDSDKSGIGKDLIKSVFLNALPSDAEAFFRGLEAQMGGISGATSVDELLQTPQGMRSLYTQMVNMQHNKKEYETLHTQLYSNGGLNEAAITGRGTMIVRDEKGSIRELSISDYANNKDKFQVVTNNELLNTRSRDLNQAFTHQFLSIAKNGTGMKEVTDTISNLTKDLKYASTTNEEYLDPQQRQILQGLKDILTEGLNENQRRYVAEKGQIGEETEGAQGTIKMKTEQKEANIQAALSYVLGNLTENQRSILAITAARNGEKDINKGMFDIVKNFLQMKSPGEFSRTYTGGLKDDGSGSGDGSGKGGANLNFKTVVQQGMNNPIESQINLGGKVSMFTSARPFNQLLGKDDVAIPQGTNVIDAINESLPGIVDINSAYIGDQRVSTEMMNRIAYTGGKGASVLLPYVNEGGLIKPDFDAIRRMQEANSIIEKENITDPSKVAGIYDRYNVSQYVNPDPNNTKIFAKFVQIPVYTPTAGIISNTESPFIQKLSGLEEAAAERLLKKAYTGSYDGKLDYESMWRFDDIYKTNMYVHQSGSDVDAAIGSGTIIAPKLSVEEAYMRREALEKQRKQRGAVTGKDVYN